MIKSAGACVFLIIVGGHLFWLYPSSTLWNLPESCKEGDLLATGIWGGVAPEPVYGIDE